MPWLFPGSGTLLRVINFIFLEEWVWSSGLCCGVSSAGGFSVVDMKSKVCSLLDLVQWVRCFSSSLSGWVSYFPYYCTVYFFIYLFNFIYTRIKTSGPFIKTSVPFFLERRLLLFQLALQLFLLLPFLLSTVPCWRLSGRRTVLFPSVAHLLSSLLCLQLAFNLDWSVVWRPLFGMPFAVALDSLSCSLDRCFNVLLCTFFVSL